MSEPKKAAPNGIRDALSVWLFSPLQGLTFARWRQFVSESQGAIPPAYWPKLMFAGMTSLNNSYQSRIERKRFGAAIDAAEVRSPVFVLGHYRSGTTHLQNLLSVDERLAFPNYYQVSFPETFLSTEEFGSRIGSLFAMRKRPQDDMAIGLQLPAEEELGLCIENLLSMHMCWHLPRREQHFRKYLTFRDASAEERARWIEGTRKLARKLTVRHERSIVFKSPCHTARIPLILEAFPDAKFIHIARDPFKVYQSTRNMEIKVSPLFQFQRRPLGEELEEFIFWRYRELYDAYLDAKDSVPAGQLVEIHYEDLVREPLATMQKVYDGVDLGPFDDVRPAIESYLSSVKSYRTNRYESMDPELERRIRTEWRRVFDAWGYDDRSGTERPSDSERRPA